MINNSKWIWAENTHDVNEYADFIHEFTLNTADKNAIMQICVDSEYMLYINGEFVSCGQYSDYPENKKYDELNVGKFLKNGKNKIAITAYYQGKSTSRYKSGKRGLIFALKNGNDIITSSNKTLCRISKTYKSGEIHLTTMQMGFGFEYDATKEDGFYKEDYNITSEWKNATKKTINTSLNKRPISKLNILEFPKAKTLTQGNFIRKSTSDLASELVYSDYLSYTKFDEFFEGEKEFPVKLIGKSSDSDGIYLIVDLGREVCGYIHFTLSTDEGALVEISHGEHLEDMRVRSKIDCRNFTDTYICREGKQTFTHYTRKVACRYLQINISNFKNLSVDYAGIKPLEYPFTSEAEFKCSDTLHNKIFKTCVDTLKLCMHEHYEDCPWREQALYASDARNASVCAHYTLGNSTKFTRASLMLLLESVLGETYVNLTAPAKEELTIPSFTMLYFLAVKEYTDFSGDTSFIKENWEKLKKMVANFSSNSVDGILKPVEIEGIKLWNFYEWSDDDWKLKKLISEKADEICDGLYHIFAYMAITSAIWIAKKVNDNSFTQKYSLLSENMKKVFNQKFWNEEKKAFASHILDGEHIRFDELTQALAVFTGICDEDKEDSVLSTLANCDNGLCKLSLSYLIYKYEALLKKGMKYADVVFEEIGEKWGKMLFAGSTSFWEAENGSEAFGRAGSLCHAWSATPIIIYCKYVLGVEFSDGKISLSENPLCADYFSKIEAKLPITETAFEK